MQKTKVSKVLAQRQALGLNQTTFWRTVGVTQSCGSRYENGFAMPKPVKQLLELVYGSTPLKALSKLRHIGVDTLKAGR